MNCTQNLVRVAHDHVEYVGSKSLFREGMTFEVLADQPLTEQAKEILDSCGLI